MKAEAIVSSVKARLEKPRRYRAYEVYRTRQFSHLGAVLMSPCLVVPLSIPFVVADGSLTLWRRALVVAFLAICSWGLWLLVDRTTRAGAYVRDNQVVIRNQVRTEHLSLDQIARFAEVPNGRSTIGAAELTDGSRILIFGIEGQHRDLWPNSQWASAPVDELNQLLADRRTGRVATSHEWKLPPRALDTGSGTKPPSTEHLKRSLRAYKLWFTASLATYLGSAAVIFAFRSQVLGALVLLVGIIGLPLGWRSVRADYQRRLAEGRGSRGI